MHRTPTIAQLPTHSIQAKATSASSSRTVKYQQVAHPYKMFMLAPSTEKVSVGPPCTITIYQNEIDVKNTGSSNICIRYTDPNITCSDDAIEVIMTSLKQKYPPSSSELPLKKRFTTLLKCLRDCASSNKALQSVNSYIQMLPASYNSLKLSISTSATDTKTSESHSSYTTPTFSATKFLTDSSSTSSNTPTPVSSKSKSKRRHSDLINSDIDISPITVDPYSIEEDITTYPLNRSTSLSEPETTISFLSNHLATINSATLSGSLSFKTPSALAFSLSKDTTENRVKSLIMSLSAAILSKSGVQIGLGFEDSPEDKDDVANFFINSPGSLSFFQTLRAHSNGDSKQSLLHALARLVTPRTAPTINDSEGWRNLLSTFLSLSGKHSTAYTNFWNKVATNLASDSPEASTGSSMSSHSSSAAETPNKLSKVDDGDSITIPS